MKNEDILIWLRDLEQRAARLYNTCAALSHSDPELRDFFLLLEREEICHSDILSDILNSLSEKTHAESPILIDRDAMDIIGEPIAALEQLVASGQINMTRVYESIIDIEFSELNYVFVYMLNYLAGAKNGVLHLIKKVEDHKKRIEEHIRTLPAAYELLNRIEKMPRLLDKRLLVVDDVYYIRDMIEAIFADEYHVKGAADGSDALDKISRNYFDVIISDLDMPRMNGISFYKNAVARDPYIGDRFLFLSGGISAEHRDFFQGNNVRFLLKPAPITAIKAAIKDITETSRLMAAKEGREPLPEYRNLSNNCSIKF